MTERYALPPGHSGDLRREVVAWLAANGIEAKTIPINSDVRVTDGRIHYVSWQTKGSREETPLSVPLVEPMPRSLSDRWRIPHRHMSPLPADELSFVSQVVTHCARPMRYINSRTTWEGKPDQGAEITTTQRTCEQCGAELSTTLRASA